MNIKINQQIDPDLWNRLVDCKIFFRYEWLYVIQNSYNLEPYFALCHRNDKFALVASFKTINGYISLPFVSYSGFLSNDKEMLNLLTKHLKANNIDIDERALEYKPIEAGYVNPIVEIHSFDEFWKNLSTNTRNQFRKSEKNNFTFTEEYNHKFFYKIYSLGMRNLGTPCHGNIFFEQLTKYFNYKIFTVYDNSEPIGSMFCLRNSDTLSVLYAYVLPSHSKKYANYFMYLNAIHWLIDNKLKYLDMGRSTIGEGTFSFKRKFKPTIYAISSKTNYKYNKKLLIASEVWKHLPLALTNALGPKIRKYLP